LRPSDHRLLATSRGGKPASWRAGLGKPSSSGPSPASPNSTAIPRPRRRRAPPRHHLWLEMQEAPANRQTRHRSDRHGFRPDERTRRAPRRPRALTMAEYFTMKPARTRVSSTTFPLHPGRLRYQHCSEECPRPSAISQPRHRNGEPGRITSARRRVTSVGGNVPADDPTDPAPPTPSPRRVHLSGPHAARNLSRRRSAGLLARPSATSSAKNTTASPAACRHPAAPRPQDIIAILGIDELRKKTN
jgi:hypothetical protein